MKVGEGPVIWSGSRIASPGLMAFGLGVLGVVAAISIDSARAANLLVVVVAVPIFVTYAYVRVDVTTHHVQARLGPIGWPRVTRKITDIVEAEAIHVNPWRYGGWGHRFTFRATALVIRGGPGLLLKPKKGRPLVITVENPTEAATVINDLIPARR